MRSVFVMNVCVLRGKITRARPAEIWFCAHALPRVPRDVAARSVSVRAGLLAKVHLTFLSNARLLLPSHIIRCSSDQTDTLLSTNVAEEQDAS